MYVYISEFAWTKTITDILNKQLFTAIIRPYIWQYMTFANKKRSKPSPRIRVKLNSCVLNCLTYLLALPYLAYT